MARPRLFAALLLVALACGDDDAPRDGGVDAGAPDTGSEDAGEHGEDAGGADAGTDAGPASRPFCAPCRRDADCGEGLCLVLADGERGCGVPCEPAGCGGLGLEASCEEELPGLPRQCRPTAGTCTLTEPGAACGSDGDCAGRYDTCVDAEGLGGACSHACDVDADCPAGLRRCRVVDGARVCVPDERPAQRCADLLAREGWASCEGEGDCPAGERCVGAGALQVCAPTPGEAGCPAGSAAATAPGGEEACVPAGLDPELLACACLLGQPGALLDEAAAELGRTRCELGFGFWARLVPEIGRDPWRLSFTDRALAHWPLAVTLAERTRDGLGAGGPISGPLEEATRRADLELAGEPAPAPSGSLLDALRRVAAASGFEGEDAILELAAAGVEDAALADALAGVLDAVAVALEEREAALARIDDRARYYEGPSGLLAPGLRGLDLRRADDRGALRGDVDVGRLAGAAHGLARALEAAALERFAGQSATFTLDTPAGRVALRGGGDHVYDEADWAETLLLVDLGGDDTYRFPAGATTGPAHGVALVVDVGGADEYGYVAVPDPQDEGPEGHARLPSDGAGRREPGESNGPSSLSTTARQGAGLLGVGMLVDLGTAPDRYRSLRMSQGYGALGVGLLYDAGGDDVYEAEALAQGAAAFGLGLLVDEGGADRYVAYTMAQGFAYARAVGVLEERGGDDEYLLHPSDVLYWSAQDPGASNSSLGQGMGFGRRADFLPDGVFMSGGLGVLHDASGADRYTAAIFAQGSGFWFGTGLLLEDGGDDRYDGQWYVQGGAAHFAVAALLEGGGDDDYNALARRQNVVFGGGHDFSVAWLVERAGADVYRGPGLSFGSGNQAGAGLFVDAAGADRYDATRDFGFGDASVRSDDAFRRSEGTFGVFLEADGVDEYVRPTVAPLANDARWTQRQHEGEGSEQGVGIDATGAAPGI